MVSFVTLKVEKIFLGITDDCKIKGIKITNKLKPQVQDIACDPSIKLI